MTGIVLLDVAIGVFFALLIYSLAATAIQEAFSNLLNLRGKKLREGIYRLVGKELGPKVMGKAPIKALHGPGGILGSTTIGNTTEVGRLPSAIPSASFAKALMLTLVREYGKLKEKTSAADKALKGMKDKVAKIEIDQGLRDRLMKYLDDADKAEGVLGTVDDALARVRDRLDLLDLSAVDDKKVKAVLNRITKGTGAVRESIPAALEALRDTLGSTDLTDALKTHLTGVINHVEEGIDAARAELVATVELLEAEIAGRFDTAMDRVTGWYVRQAKLVLFVIGFSLALVTNFDVIRYAGDLVKNEDLRAKIVAQAEVIGNTAKFIEAKDALDFTEQPAVENPESLTFEVAAKNVNTTAMNAMTSLQSQLGNQGVTLGWACKAEPSYCACIWKNISMLGLLSWLLIGFACTMGGQFWYDALKKLMSARTMVAGAAAPAPTQPAAKKDAAAGGAGAK